MKSLSEIGHLGVKRTKTIDNFSAYVVIANLGLIQFLELSDRRKFFSGCQKNRCVGVPSCSVEVILGVGMRGVYRLTINFLVNSINIRIFAAVFEGKKLSGVEDECFVVQCFEK